MALTGLQHAIPCLSLPIARMYSPVNLTPSMHDFFFFFFNHCAVLSVLRIHELWSSTDAPVCTHGSLERSREVTGRAGCSCRM